MNPARLTPSVQSISRTSHTDHKVAFSRLRLSNVSRRAAGADARAPITETGVRVTKRAIRERRFALDDAAQLLLLVPEL